MENSIAALKSDSNEFEAEYEIIAVFDDTQTYKSTKSFVQKQIEISQNEIEEINSRLAKYENNADWLDYTVAVSSGIICGLIDSVVVGELKLEDSKAWSNELVNNFIKKYASTKGIKKDRLRDIVGELEKRYPVPQDNSWSGKGISSTFSHHLDDLAHHPTVFGLLAGILAQVFQIGIFSDKTGENSLIPVGTNGKEYLKNVLMPLLVGAMISGICCWLANMAEKKYEETTEKDIPEPIKKLIGIITKAPAIIPILRFVNTWFSHLVSDMAGSKTTAGLSGGMGIPGVFLSLLKEISMLPGINKSGLPALLNKLYTSPQKLGLTDKLDMRTELAIIKEQAMPVIVNEILVRSFYFIRHLAAELKEKKSENRPILGVARITRFTLCST